METVQGSGLHGIVRVALVRGKHMAAKLELTVLVMVQGLLSEHGPGTAGGQSTSLAAIVSSDSSVAGRNPFWMFCLGLRSPRKRVPLH